MGLVSVLMALYNVYREQRQRQQQRQTRTGSWGTYVFCGDKTRAYTESCLRPHFANADADLNVISVPEMSRTNEFSIEDYNELLKSPGLWERIDARKCLIVQDDGMLVRPGVQERFMDRYDYVGAPWLSGQIALERVTNPELVGNGGLSVRTTQAMLDVARKGRSTLHEHDLFINGAQSCPEDVYFSGGVHSLRESKGYVVADRRAACAFSSEQVIEKESVGFHKPWPYHPTRVVASYFEHILSSE